MNTLTNQINKEQKRISWLPIVFILLLATVIVWVVVQFKDEKRFAVVKFNGKGNVINLSKSYNLSFFSSTKKNKGALLAEKGDVLAFNDVMVHFNDVKNDSLNVNDTGDSLVFVNGKINSIVISGKEDLLTWFRSMKPETVSELQSISFNSAIPESYIPYLKELARLKPNTALDFREDDSVNILDDYLKKAHFFTPYLVKASVTQDQLPLLARFKSASSIYLALIDSVVTTSLPAMPALKQCILYTDEMKSITASFLSNNSQLEKVALLGLPDYSLLKPLKKLDELTVNKTKQVGDVAVLKNTFNNLSVLIVSDTFTNIDLLAGMKKLRWLGLPANTSQQQFDTITAKLSNLQVLELTGSDLITQLTPLQQMPNLSGLVITDTVTDKPALYAMKNLRYLSLPEDNKEDSTYLLALEKALPGCIIIPNSGACLGSGWLLLLVPLLLIIGFIFHNKLLKNSLYEKP